MNKTVDQYQVHANAITGEWITEPVFVGKVDLAEWNKLPYTERYAHSAYEVTGEDGTTITRALRVIWERPSDDLTTARTLRSKYVEGSDGSHRLFLRPKGFPYIDQNGEDAVSPGEIVRQWGGDTGHDSGYSQDVWPLTPDGLTEALAAWDAEFPPEVARPSATYTEHRSIDVHGFNVTDATSVDPSHGHDDLIWIGTQDAGIWVTPDRAREVAAAIISVADSHDKRHGRKQ